MYAQAKNITAHKQAAAVLEQEQEPAHGWLLPAPATLQAHRHTFTESRGWYVIDYYDGPVCRCRCSCGRTSEPGPVYGITVYHCPGCGKRETFEQAAAAHRLAHI